MNTNERTEGQLLAELQHAYDNRPVIERRWYKRATIKLDGYHFNGCLFEDCTLWYETLDFLLTDCDVKGKITVTPKRPPPVQDDGRAGSNPT